MEIEVEKEKAAITCPFNKHNYWCNVLQRHCFNIPDDCPLKEGPVTVRIKEKP